MSSEVAGNYVHSLTSLIAPYATESSSQRLPFDNRKGIQYQPALPEQVVATMVQSALKLKGGPMEIEEGVINDFLGRCVGERAVQVAASIIRHNNGAHYSKLEAVQKDYNLPFNMDAEFQRRLLRRAAQYEQIALQKGLDRQLAENPLWDGIPKLRGQLKLHEDFVRLIDEREVTPPAYGQLS